MMKKILIGIISVVGTTAVGIGLFLFVFTSAMDLDRFVADYEAAYRQEISFQEHTKYSVN
ncbi:hypothetical protein KFU94_12400 [Chloroflexi bacterium TSY]|nr:hypothetical protein [Chloroflexi bacterium TSY]